MQTNKKAVLLIEDNVLLTDLYSIALKKRGLDVVFVHNGDEGLKAIENHCPDVVLLDLGLPGMSGLEVLEKIRSNPKTKDLKVIILSLNQKEENKKKAEELGIFGFLLKTEFHLDEIAEKILLCINS